MMLHFYFCNCNKWMDRNYLEIETLIFVSYSLIEPRERDSPSDVVDKNEINISLVLMDDLVAIIRNQIPSARQSVLQAYSQVLVQVKLLVALASLLY